jgi:hypothetical protein
MRKKIYKIPNALFGLIEEYRRIMLAALQQCEAVQLSTQFKVAVHQCLVKPNSSFEIASVVSSKKPNTS